MIKNVKSRQEVLEFDFFGFRPSSRKTPMRRAALLALPLFFATYFVSACSDSVATIPAIAYPETKRGDEFKWARFTSIKWTKDGSGFFYAHFPEPKQGTASQASVENHAVYFHAIGTPQAQDRLVYATPNQPSLLQSLSVSPEAAFITGASLKIDGGLAA
ncbi:peptidase S9 [Calothrix sp. PCC 7507]|uniref:peptidase S9 n=1 Tax=Calothrix sp. PCC 7507 TaxID=99598 RepID=UPI00029F1757|nr:peptidase S9 [Calothrix sp. PCC 7507]AFY35962.1 peptidase S9A prolyl oligopeptidase domain protein beta-propeller [Calothrix sp. PCC 7507]